MTPPRMRTWRCATCGLTGKALDPSKELVEHWQANHHTPAPF